MSAISKASASLPSSVEIAGSQRYVPPEKMKVSEVMKILHKCTRPPFYNRKPKDEEELQIVIHAICLCAIDPQVKRERSGLRIGEKEKKIDFSLFSDRDALEIKLITEKRRRSAIVGEISEVIMAFRKPNQFKNLIFLIYDAEGEIYDEMTFKKEFESNENVHVIIRKH